MDGYFVFERQYPGWIHLVVLALSVFLFSVVYQLLSWVVCKSYRKEYYVPGGRTVWYIMAEVFVLWFFSMVVYVSVSSLEGIVYGSYTMVLALLLTALFRYCPLSVYLLRKLNQRPVQLEWVRTHLSLFTRLIILLALEHLTCRRVLYRYELDVNGVADELRRLMQDPSRWEGMNQSVHTRSLFTAQALVYGYNIPVTPVYNLTVANMTRALIRHRFTVTAPFILSMLKTVGYLLQPAFWLFLFVVSIQYLSIHQGEIGLDMDFFYLLMFLAPIIIVSINADLLLGDRKRPFVEKHHERLLLNVRYAGSDFKLRKQVLKRFCYLPETNIHSVANITDQGAFVWGCASARHHSLANAQHDLYGHSRTRSQGFVNTKGEYMNRRGAMSSLPKDSYHWKDRMLLDELYSENLC